MNLPTPGGRRALLFTVLLLALARPRGAARADEPASQPTSQPAAAWPWPWPEPSREPGRVLTVDELRFGLGFEGDWRRRLTRTQLDGLFSRVERQRDSYRSLQEYAEVESAGNILNERFLRYQFRFDYGLSQDAYTEQGPRLDLSDDSQGDLVRYDARVTLFPAGRVTANLGARRLDERVPRLFLPSLDRVREEYTAEVLLNDRVLPMRLTFEDYDEDLSSSVRRDLDDERRRERRVEYEAVWHQTEYNQLRLNYGYTDRSERYSGSENEFENTRNDLEIEQVVQFGPDRRSRLEAALRYQDEGRDLERDLFEGDARLRLQHSDEFATTYRALYNDQTYAGFSTQQSRAELGAEWQPGDWLFGAANLYAARQSAERSREADEWGAYGHAALTVPNELGRLRVDGSLAYAQIDADADTPTSVVIGESATLNDPLPAYLARSDVLRTSIVVTDANRTRTYTPGRDYLVIQAGRYTALRRMLTGRIVDGQTVLVNYLYRVDRSYGLHRVRADLRVQQEFKGGLVPYYAVTLQEEDVEDQRFLGYQPRDIQRQRLGVNYRQPRWSAGAELEDNDDTIDPYRAAHVRADAQVLDSAPHALSLRGDLSYFDYEGTRDLDSRHVWLGDLGADYQYTISADLLASVLAVYRYEDESDFGITHGVDVGAGLHWQIGEFTASIEFEYNLLEQPRSSDGDIGVFVKVKRGFPVIRPGDR